MFVKKLVLIVFLLFLIPNAFSWNGEKIGPTFSIGSDQYYTYYDSSSDNFVIRFATNDGIANTPSGFYNFVQSVSWISSNTCQPTIDTTLNAVKVNFNPNVYMNSQRNLVFGGTTYTTSQHVTEQMMEMNYRMRVNFTFQILKNNNQIVEESSTEVKIPYNSLQFSNPYQESYLDSLASLHGPGTYSVVFTAQAVDGKCPSVGSDSKTLFSKDYHEVGIHLSIPSGKYMYKPSDGQGPEILATVEWNTTNADTCDVLGSSVQTETYDPTTGQGAAIFTLPAGANEEVQTILCTNNLGFSNSTNIYILRDSDGDGVEDYYNAEVRDKCPLRPWMEAATENKYSGCPYAYTFKDSTNTCQGAMSFDEQGQRLYSGSDMYKFGIGYSCWVNSQDNCGWQNIQDNNGAYAPNRGEGRYLSVNDDYWYFIGYEPERVQGFCDLQFNPASYCSGPDGRTFEIGTTNIVYFKKEFDNEKEYSCNNNWRKEFRCDNQGNLVPMGGGSASIITSYPYPVCRDFSSDYDGTQLTYKDGEPYLTEDDSSTLNKIETNLETGLMTIRVGSNATEEIVNYTETANETKTIKIFKDGVNIRNDTIDPVTVGIKMHKIKKHKTGEEAAKFIDKSVSLMKKFDIVKNLTYDGTEDKTSIKIQLDNIPQNERTNLTVYQVIDKDVASTYSEINFISDGGGERFVVDKDPVIGWYFNDSGDGTDVEYEIPGESEGGTIIITQEAILYNEGELVVNYREEGCNPGEAHLFNIDDLENSNVLSPSSLATYEVCLAHINDSITIFNDNTTGDTPLPIFDYIDGGNVSLVANALTTNSLDVSVNQPGGNTIYWDLKIQSNNPSGNYSCLGSVLKSNDSKFGDCGYTTNRIWIHLGDDKTPPTTTVTYPQVAHTLNVEVTAQDNIGGSGVDEMSYCVDESNSCTPGVNGESFDTLTQAQLPGRFITSCPYDWGCIKYVRMTSTDNEGNVESLNTEVLRLIDKGSSCQADCSAKPSPNRYLKECQNLNSCQYYNYQGDGGDTVAEACDFQIIGAWAQLNATHDVKCPSGPLRESKFTAQDVDLSDTLCRDVLTIPFVTLFEGETVTMRVVSCQDRIE